MFLARALPRQSVMETTILGRPMGAPGFTLVELTISLTIVAIMVGLSLSGAAAISSRWRAREGADLTVGTLRRVRWQAITRGVEQSVTAVADAGGTWRLLVWLREEGGWRLTGTVILPREVTAIRMIGPIRKEFNPDGTCSTGSILLSGGGRSWRISLTSATGRARIYREG